MAEEAREEDCISCKLLGVAGAFGAASYCGYIVSKMPVKSKLKGVIIGLGVGMCSR